MAPTDESAEALTRTLQDLLKDPVRLAWMGRHAAEWARQAFAPERYAAARRPEAAVTPQVAADATGRRLRELASALRRRRHRAPGGPHRWLQRRRRPRRPGLGGIIVARALGPEMRGDYAAVTAWFGVALMIGGMGQPAALCFHVAHDPGNARGYVATSRAMMLVTGTAALAGGILLAPLLARGNAGLTVAYRIAFATSIVAFVGASYTFSLQARNLRWWNDGAGEPAGAEPGVPRRAVAAAAAHADRRADRPGPHHARPARLGLLPLPVGRPGARPGSGPARPAPGRVRHGPDRGPDAGGPQRPGSTSSSCPRPCPRRSSAGTRSRSRAPCSRSRWYRRSATSPSRGWRRGTTWTAGRTGCSGWASWAAPAPRRPRWCRWPWSRPGSSRASSGPGTPAWCRCCGS